MFLFQIEILKLTLSWANLVFLSIRTTSWLKNEDVHPCLCKISSGWISRHNITIPTIRFRLTRNKLQLHKDHCDRCNKYHEILLEVRLRIKKDTTGGYRTDRSWYSAMILIGRLSLKCWNTCQYWQISRDKEKRNCFELEIWVVPRDKCVVKSLGTVLRAKAYI